MNFIHLVMNKPKLLTWELGVVGLVVVGLGFAEFGKFATEFSTEYAMKFSTEYATVHSTRYVLI